LPLEQVMVVAPYNAQVRCLRDTLPAGVRVGTVDKFQGQEAAIVFFSMATSSGAEIPRNVEFLFSRNRLNVAVSRARCLAVLVCSPRLLHVGAGTLRKCDSSMCCACWWSSLRVEPDEQPTHAGDSALGSTSGVAFS
jgi:hypothetical protein